MIKFENVTTHGFSEAIRGMRNPMNSWVNSDSYFDVWSSYQVGVEDMYLMKTLCKAGSDHRKFMRMITVYVDITAPLYWWKEFDTYKVGTVANSCSTMHKLTAKEFTIDDFSHDHLMLSSVSVLEHTIEELNKLRTAYKVSSSLDSETKRELWYNMIQLLPSSYNQRRTVMLNYEVLTNIYKSRRNHKLDEWRVFCEEFVKPLQCSELITGMKKEGI